MNKILILLAIVFTISHAKAQVGIGVTTPDPSSILQVQDTTKGILIPRMKDINRIAIVSPAEGLLVYQTNVDKGFWYFTNGQWKNMSASNNGGKHTLLLSNDITNAEAAARIASDVGPNTQEVKILSCTNLATVDLSAATRLATISIMNNPVLTSINFSNLQGVDDYVQMVSNRLLTNLTLTSLQTVGSSFQIAVTKVTSLNMPALTKIGGVVNISLDSSLTTINAPLLTQLPYVDPGGSGSSTIRSNPLLTSILMPGLTKMGDLTINDNSHLNTINLNGLVSANVVSFSTLPLLTTVSFPALKNANSISISTTNALNSVSLPLLDTLTSGFSINVAPVFSNASFPSLTTCGGIGLTGLPALTTFSAPLLKKLTLTATSLQIAQCTNLNTVTLPLLTNVAGAIVVQTNPALTSLPLPSITVMPNCSITDNANLTSVNLTGMTSLGGTGFNISSNKLPSAEVNALLHQLVIALPAFINRVITLTQTVAATPTGQGITDKATLIARPNTVTTN